ncbi:MAG: ATP-binding protein [Thermoleophilia bacterium]|nr:ATP-binding protein [Thermoleophilia bacterium]MDH3724518.1 ATP-binding protein [Thermoleophilia bacterium]
MEMAGWFVAIATILVALSAILWMGRRSRASSGGSHLDDERPAESMAEPALGAFAALPLPAIVVDDEARVRRLSQGARAKFPFLDVGSDLLSAFGELELASRVAQAVRLGEPQQFDTRLFVDRRGTYRVTVAPIADDSAVVCIADATEAVDYQELRMQFVSNVSHELRTPLTGLRGLLEALDHDDLDRDARLRFARRAQHEVGRLAAIIDDVMLLSELETSSAPLTEEPVEIGVAAASAAATLAGQAEQSGVELVTDLEQGLLAPLTPRMAEMVVGNLLTNAINYAGAGARATVRTYRSDDDLILEVADDGVGIGEEHLPHVFERFYRADRSRSNQVGGTGLGLAIVKHIADRAGGEATATSRPGYGTTVRVRLPLAGVTAGSKLAPRD